MDRDTLPAIPARVLALAEHVTNPDGARAAIGIGAPKIGAMYLDWAAARLLATGSHEDLCSYGPPGTCDCALGEHYRWLLDLAQELREGGT